MQIYIIAVAVILLTLLSSIKTFFDFSAYEIVGNR